jgi:hypothetical protein
VASSIEAKGDIPVAPDLIRQNVEREVVKAATLRDMSRFDPNAN